MATFEEAVVVVLQHEGLLSTHPQDAGGATKYGISLAWLQQIGTAGDLDHNGVVNQADVQQLTRTQAIELFKTRWWRPEYEQLSQLLANKILDTAVNMGPTAAHRILQEALNSIGWKITIDGLIGPNTIQACNSTPGDELLQEYRAAQALEYCEIVFTKPDQTLFLRGWLRRAVS